MPETANRPLKVLIVDDELEVRELLAEYFAEVGYDVTTAPDGNAAVADLTANPTQYQLVISDLQMPGIDGLGVLEAAKKANPSIAVIIVTGYASVDSAVRAVRMGAYDYLTKPFTLGQIEVIVRRAAERLALEAENRHLAQRIGGIDQAELDTPVLARLEAIDQRLARIEHLLNELPSPARHA
jgi:two-component system response regulator AtoC